MGDNTATHMTCDRGQHMVNYSEFHTELCRVRDEHYYIIYVGLTVLIASKIGT